MRNANRSRGDRRPFPLPKAGLVAAMRARTSDAHAGLVAALFTQKYEGAVPQAADETPRAYYLRALEWVGSDAGRRAMEDAILEASRLVDQTVASN